jgi:Fe-S-cluster containining protein
VLDAWLGEKGSLYTKDSLFRCDDACPRYGCRGELLVDASLLEVCVLARHLGRLALEVFDRYCSMVPFVEHGFEAARIRFVLRKPCLFLDNSGYCTIYATRPAACALFPEFLSLQGNRKDYVIGNGLGYYPCIEHFAQVPEARKDALAALWKIHQKEIYAGEIYLFGRAGFTVDLREELGRRYEGREGGAVPFSIQTDALHASLSAGGWWDRIREKIEALDTPDGLGALLSGIKIVEALNL